MLETVLNYTAHQNRAPTPLDALTIGPSTKGDLRKVLRWLESEWDDVSGAWQNRAMIAEAHDRGMLIVLRCGALAVVGFAVLTSDTIFIVQVRGQYRRGGHGRRLMTYCLDDLRGRGLTSVEIECVSVAGLKLALSTGFERLIQPRSSSTLDGWLPRSDINYVDIYRGQDNASIPTVRMRKAL